MKKWMAVMIAAFIALIGTHSFAQENMSSTGSPYLYADGWLYRTVYLEGERQLVRSRSDGMDARRVSRGYGSYSGFSVSGDSVFYLGTEKELGGFDTRTQIWAVNVDGQNDRPLTALAEYTNLFASNTHVYAEVDGGQLIRYRIEPWAEERRIDLPAGSYLFGIVDGWLYYNLSGEQGGIGRMKAEGGEPEIVLAVEEGAELTAYGMMNGNLYYCLLDEPSTTSELYRMPLDGSEREPVERGAFTISKLEAGWAFGMRVSAGDPAFDSAWSLDYEDTFCMNLQTGKMLEMGRSRGPNSFYPAGDYLIFDAFDEGRSPLLISPQDGSTQMLPEPVLPN